MRVDDNKAIVTWKLSVTEDVTYRIQIDCVSDGCEENTLIRYVSKTATTASIELEWERHYYLQVFSVGKNGILSPKSDVLLRISIGIDIL